MFKSLARNSLSSIYSSRSIRYLTNALTQNYTCVFMLHRFKGDDTPAHAEHQAEFLQQILEEIRRFKIPVASLDDLVKAKLGQIDIPRNAIAFTMDDGFHDQANVGAELFIKYDIPATIFTVTDFLDNNFWPVDCQAEYIISQTKKPSFEFIDANNQKHHFDCRQNYRACRQAIELVRQYSLEQALLLVQTLAKAAEVELPIQPPIQYSPMSWNKARELSGRGISIGPHTCKHPLLSQEDDDSAQHQIQCSISRLEQEIQQNRSQVFCYPTGRVGDFSEREEKLALQAGCIGAVNAQPGYMQLSNTSNLFNIDRFAFPDTLSDFRQYAYKLERLKQILRRNK